MTFRLLILAIQLKKLTTTQKLMKSKKKKKNHDHDNYIQFKNLISSTRTRRFETIFGNEKPFSL